MIHCATPQTANLITRAVSSFLTRVTRLLTQTFLLTRGTNRYVQVELIDAAVELLDAIRLSDCSPLLLRRV